MSVAGVSGVGSTAGVVACWMIVCAGSWSCLICCEMTFWLSMRVLIAAPSCWLNAACWSSIVLHPTI